MVRWELCNFWLPFNELSTPELSLKIINIGMKCVCLWERVSCVWLCDPMDCSPPGFSVHGIFQARILEWVAIFFSREPSQLRDWTPVFCISGRFFTIWATREALDMNYLMPKKLFWIISNFPTYTFILTVFSIHFIICLPMKDLGPCRCLHGLSHFVREKD